MANTSKRERFEKVAAARVQRIISTLELLQNCSNRNNYEYSDRDVNLMFDEISKSLKEARNAFNSELSKLNNKEGFSFNK